LKKSLSSEELAKNMADYTRLFALIVLAGVMVGALIVACILTLQGLPVPGWLEGLLGTGVVYGLKILDVHQTQQTLNDKNNQGGSTNGTAGTV
jgi:hypothetical protein